MYANNHLKRLYTNSVKISINSFYFFFYFFHCQFIFLFYTLYSLLLNNPLTMNIILPKSIETNMNYVFVGLNSFFFLFFFILWKNCLDSKEEKIFGPKYKQKKKVRFHWRITQKKKKKQLRVDYRKLLDIF